MRHLLGIPWHLDSLLAFTYPFHQELKCNTVILCSMELSLMLVHVNNMLIGTALCRRKVKKYPSNRRNRASALGVTQGQSRECLRALLISGIFFLMNFWSQRNDERAEPEVGASLARILPLLTIPDDVSLRHFHCSMMSCSQLSHSRPRCKLQLAQIFSSSAVLTIQEQRLQRP